MSNWSGDSKPYKVRPVFSPKRGGGGFRPLAWIILLILVLSQCSAGFPQPGVGCFQGPAWDNYISAVKEDGDYLNDWLTHTDPTCRPVVLEVGKRYAAR